MKLLKILLCCIVIGVGQTQMHVARSLIPGPISFEFEIAIKNFKKCKISYVHQISAEFIEAGRKTVRSEILKLASSINEQTKL